MKVIILFIIEEIATIYDYLPELDCLVAAGSLQCLSFYDPCVHQIYLRKYTFIIDLEYKN